jgi:hypothetical protein
MKNLLAFCACVLIAPVVLGALDDADAEDPCRRFNTMNACGDAANEKCQWCGNATTYNASNVAFCYSTDLGSCCDAHNFGVAGCSNRVMECPKPMTCSKLQVATANGTCNHVKCCPPERSYLCNNGICVTNQFECCTSGGMCDLASATCCGTNSSSVACCNNVGYHCCMRGGDAWCCGDHWRCYYEKKGCEPTVALDQAVPAVYFQP